MDDRRSVGRTRIVKDVKILANHVSIPCTILDLTNGGACIAFAHACDVPDHFELAFGTRHARRACRVTWRTGNQVGVAFEPLP
jgi:PilZ domain-containing protein